MRQIHDWPDHGAWLLELNGRAPGLYANSAHVQHGWQSPLDADLSYVNGVVRGQLRWSMACRRAAEERSHEEAFTVSSPDTARGAAALAVGSLLSLGSVALLSSGADLDRESCSTDADGS